MARGGEGRPLAAFLRVLVFLSSVVRAREYIMWVTLATWCVGIRTNFYPTTSVVPPASFLIHPRERKIIMWSQTAVIQKNLLGKLRMLESITREHRWQRDGHVCLRKKWKCKLRMLESITREHRWQRDAYARRRNDIHWLVGIWRKQPSDRVQRNMYAAVHPVYISFNV